MIEAGRRPTSQKEPNTAPRLAATNMFFIHLAMPKILNDRLRLTFLALLVLLVQLVLFLVYSATRKHFKLSPKSQGDYSGRPSKGPGALREAHSALELPTGLLLFRTLTNDLQT